MNYKFVPHNYVRKYNGKVTLLLDLSQDGKRHKEAVNDIYMDPNGILKRQHFLKV